MRISVDGRRIRNSKVAFSNLSGIYSVEEALVNFSRKIFLVVLIQASGVNVNSSTHIGLGGIGGRI